MSSRKLTGSAKAETVKSSVMTATGDGTAVITPCFPGAWDAKKLVANVHNEATLRADMNTSRQLLKTGFLATVLFAMVSPAWAVRPYTAPRGASNFYKRSTQSSLAGYILPQRKVISPVTLDSEPLHRVTLSPLRSWTGLNGADRRIRGDASPYGAVLPGKRVVTGDRRFIGGRGVTAGSSAYSIR
jgi:hypothetical protein